METYRGTIYFEKSGKTIFEDVEIIGGKAEAKAELYNLLTACYSEQWEIIDISPIEEFEINPNE